MEDDKTSEVPPERLLIPMQVRCGSHVASSNMALLPSDACPFGLEYLQEISLAKAAMVADLVLHKQCPGPLGLLERG
jgi:hypothetical protein